MRKMMVVVLAALAVLSVQAASGPKTWHVDDGWYGKGGDGSEETPFGTIQQAVDKAAAGDTILVAPGTYDKDPTSTGYRVDIPKSKPNLTIRATGGRDVTFIVGRRHSDEVPNGSDAVGGVNCNCTTGFTILDGFTFRDCHNSAATASDGAAIHGVWSQASSLQVFNCAVESCSGRSVYGVTIHSSVFTGNYATTNLSSVLFRYVTADNCIVTKTDGGGFCLNTKFVNCTIAGNAANLYADGNLGFHNSVHSMSPELRTYSKVPITNSVSSGSMTADKAFNIANNIAATNIFACLGGFSDFRLRSDSPAVARATPSILAEHVPLPSADRDPADDPGRYSTYHDAYGTPIDPAAEHINAGAIQETVVIDDSAVALTCFSHAYRAHKTLAYREPLVVDGEAFVAGEAFIRTVAACPTQWCVTAYAPESKPLSAVEDDFANLSRLSGSNGTIWVTSAPIGEVRTLTVKTAQKIFYMDPNGNDAWDGTAPTNVAGTTQGPWQTFTNAAARLLLDADGVRLMIRCAPGVYDKGERNHARAWFDGNSIGYSNAHEFHFVGVAGAARTLLVGAEATTEDKDEYGCGENAVGCLYNQGAVLGFTGFTFAGGRTDGTSNDRAAFAWNTGKNGVHHSFVGLCESVVTNNVAALHYVARADENGLIVLERCVIADNGAYTGRGFYSAKLFGCVSVNNRCLKDWPFYRYRVTAVNSTFVRGESSSSILWTESNHQAYNCIFTDCDDAKYIMTPDTVGCVYDNSKVNTKYTDKGKNMVTDAAMYVDKRGGDYRILSCSPAVGAARMDGPEYVRYAATGFEGLPVCRGVAASVSGAFTVPLASGGVYVNDPDGCLLADGAAADGAHFIPEGGTLTISANPAAPSARPIAGIAVNGVTNLFAGAAGTVAIPSEAVKDTTLAVVPVLGNVWYVNAGDDAGWAPGSDANLGWGTWTPFRTLTNAMAKAKANDVVVAAPGRYEEGATAVKIQNVSTWVRVSVPANVTLRSERGAERTFIVGADATTEDKDEYGCGENAVGCVNLADRTSAIEGFTITGGRGPNVSGSRRGSAVAAASASSGISGGSRCTDCIISNCVSANAILLYGSYNRCRIVGNRTANNIFTYRAKFSNVYIDRNQFAESGDGYCYYAQSWTNVTWGAGNLTTDGEAPKYGVTPHAIDVANSIVFGSIKGKTSDCTVVNSLITAGTFKNVDDPAAIMLDAEGRPLAVDGNLALDTGLSEIYDAGTLGDTDASGRPRVMNAKIDIGALEGDWRPRFGTDIGSRVTVTEATSGIVETDGRKVSFGAGGTVRFYWACEADRNCELALSVTGDGTLVVAREGAEPVAYAKGEHVYAFESAAAVQTFTLTYEPSENDTGSAEIVSAKRLSGLMLIVK